MSVLGQEIADCLYIGGAIILYTADESKEKSISLVSRWSNLVNTELQATLTLSRSAD